jgi:hypothetical protein
MNNDPSTSLKRKPSLDQAPVHNKRGRPPLDRNNYSKQQSSSARVEEASAFDRGFEAEKILGATDATVRFLEKQKNDFKQFYSRVN